MTYTRKTQDVWIVQHYTGKQYGWEDVTAEETRKDGLAQLKCYRENQPEIPARLIMRREKIEDPLFMGVFPAGIEYSDRTREEHGDYKYLGFLSYATLILDVAPDCPPELRTRIEKDAAKLQAQRGQPFNTTAAGQPVILGVGR